jgi:DnaJ-class molecular chaperone
MDFDPNDRAEDSGWAGPGPDPRCPWCRGAGFVDAETGVPVDVNAAYAAGSHVNAEECGCAVWPDDGPEN